jgi:hypothetical protein
MPFRGSFKPQAVEIFYSAFFTTIIYLHMKQIKVKPEPILSLFGNCRSSNRAVGDEKRGATANSRGITTDVAP